MSSNFHNLSIITIINESNEGLHINTGSTILYNTIYAPTGAYTVHLDLYSKAQFQIIIKNVKKLCLVSKVASYIISQY